MDTLIIIVLGRLAILTKNMACPHYFEHALSSCADSDIIGTQCVYVKGASVIKRTDGTEKYTLGLSPSLLQEQAMLSAHFKKRSSPR